MRGLEKEKEVNKLCPNCNSINNSNTNFCAKCGIKILEVCSNCWIKAGQPFNCKHDKCPGHRLSIEFYHKRGSNTKQGGK